MKLDRIVVKRYESEAEAIDLRPILLLSIDSDLEQNVPRGQQIRLDVQRIVRQLFLDRFGDLFSRLEAELVFAIVRRRRSEHRELRLFILFVFVCSCEISNHQCSFRLAKWEEKVVVEGDRTDGNARASLLRRESRDLERGERRRCRIGRMNE